MRNETSTDLVSSMIFYAKTKTFQRDKRTNTSVLDTSQPSVIYGDADNPNHTKIYETVDLLQRLLQV